MGILDDPDDLLAWQEWQDDYIDELQDRFGDGFIQVANGDRPLRRPEFTAHVAGVVLEDFPPTVWYYTQLQSLDLIATIESESWCTPRRGRTWSLLWDVYSRTPDFTRTCSALTGAFYALDETTSFSANDSLAKVMGTPAGSLLRTTLSDGAVRFERPMSAGLVWAEMATSQVVRAMGFEPN